MSLMPEFPPHGLRFGGHQRHHVLAAASKARSDSLQILHVASCLAYIAAVSQPGASPLKREYFHVHIGPPSVTLAVQFPCVLNRTSPISCFHSFPSPGPFGLCDGLAAVSSLAKVSHEELQETPSTFADLCSDRF